MGRKFLLAAVGILILARCSIEEQIPGDSNAGPTMQGPAEAAYCSGPATFSSPVTITGTAQYNRRDHFGNVMSSFGAAGLGSADPSVGVFRKGSTHPIRYAEIKVTNAAGALVQCTETLVDGTFSFTLPTDSATYTISINSRSVNSHLYASVLNQPAQNKFYSLTKTVVPNVSKSVGLVTALADGEMLGAAFNILDQLLNANLYLVNQVGTCNSTFYGCRNFDPMLHKISAYWMKGFNPNDYFGPGGGGLSFYLPGYSRLFILGGVDGDVDSSDTDHFDNSVILHEYGHFLEDNWATTDSPGGPHSGNEILDPRLAWSEGWGDFFQAAVRTWVNDATDNHTEHYIDTLGNIDGVTEMIFYVSTEVSPAGFGAGFDYAADPGEGNFREFAITRMLYDAIDTPADNDGVFTDNTSGKFNELWAAITKSSRGYRDSMFAFRNAGLMLLAQDWIHNNQDPLGPSDPFASDWTQIRGLNRMTASTDHYAQYMIPSAIASGGGGNCTSSPGINSTYYFTLTPTANADSNDGYGIDNGPLADSNMFLNNRFYHLHVASGGPITPGVHALQLVYQNNNTGAATIADLDLYLYNESGQFAVTSDMVSWSKSRPTTAGANIQYEQMNVNLGAGNYLLNVNVYTGGASVGGAANYNLVLDGVVLCPADLLQ